MKRVLATALLLLSAAGLASGQCGEADRQKLIAFDKAWGEAGQRGDRAALQNIYADDYMNPAPTGTLNKAQTIDEAVRDAERAKADPQAADQVAHDLYVVTCTPNTATVTHRNVVTAKADGKERNLADDYSGVSSRTGKLNTKADDVADIRNREDVYAKRDGRWVAVASQGTLIQ